MSKFIIYSCSGSSNGNSNNNATINKIVFEATNGQNTFNTTFNLNSNCLVFVNGVLIESGYIINNNSIVFNYSFDGGEIITIIN